MCLKRYAAILKRTKNLAHLKTRAVGMASIKTLQTYKKAMKQSDYVVEAEAADEHLTP